MEYMSHTTSAAVLETWIEVAKPTKEYLTHLGESGWKPGKRLPIGAENMIRPINTVNYHR